MKKITLMAVLAVATVVYSCKSKSDKDAADSTAAVESAEASTEDPPSVKEEQPANETKTYTISFSPDTAILGKSKEAFLKVIPVSATDLSDPDGKSQGIEFKFKISGTNKEKIGGNSIGIATNNFRLVLDNNTSINESNGGYFSVQPESTAESDEITYRIPAGAKPKALNLFFDETRASVGVTLK
ncbi:hypothetical protein LJ707_09890 [Mucilaginibacter sp. UR6-1]|uniref:hypothetical protein n=1 Tax=Mucilaginibacter sp. UR6-1 TaxID=1435643 RepID=UPI001E56863E|nr:hypothetical protein [Mucilaginibacter sp. UR6-1]MCC8409244.1 hypothetical protein [Mucilaginibacter sp. UR6-1]